MKIPSAQQIKELDDYTIQHENITSLELMERASGEVTKFILNTYPDTERHIVIFAGPGNNGGDGVAVARQLNARGYHNIDVYLFNTNDCLSPDCKKNATRLQTDCEAVHFTEVKQQFEAPKLSASTLIIDALFGTGLNKPLNGGFAALAKLINASNAEVISIDMPSGLMCEDNSYNTRSSIVCATHTLTFQLPKLSLLLPDCQTFVGQLHLLNIGLSEECIDNMETTFFITEAAQVRAMLNKRPAFGHKGTFGHALIIAGKYGMAGAAILAARACLRSGLGKLTLHTPRHNCNILQTTVPEALLSIDKNEEYFSAPISSTPFNAIAIGPGIGTDKHTALALIEQTSHATMPLVLDADAINILSHHKGWIPQIPAGTIFTPHPGEMLRLGICNEDSFSLLNEALSMAQRHKFYIILKGHYTAICTPERHIYFNPTGNSGMATAGSGDVLTGIITSLLAQKYTHENACRLGVYLHGLAGDIAAKKLGEECMTASDIIDALPEAFRQLKQG